VTGDHPGSRNFATKCIPGFNREHLFHQKLQQGPISCSSNGGNRGSRSKTGEKTMSKFTAIAVAASLIVGSIGTVSFTTTAAEAGQSSVKFHFGHKKHHRFGFKKRYDTGYNQYDCDFLKRKAYRTGSRYWLGEYYRCIHFDRFED
jgi:hypothetical protein